MNDQREPKRVRQACQNCRRKKTKCDGQKPTCGFCARLKQDCNYDDMSGLAGSANDVNLAARVALLEAKLGLLNADSLDVFSTHVEDINPPTKRKASFANTSASSDRQDGNLGSPSHARRLSCTNQKFSALPPEPILRSILDTWFRYCQNQPYVYFRPEHFYRRLDNNEVPEYLLMAMVALAARYSHDEFFEGRTFEAIDSYARISWGDIFEKSFSEEYQLDITAVQTTNILAVVDYTAGRHKLAWVKIGLAVRFAQSLQLGTEPSDDLPLHDQDERRLTFWSVYLLDRLVSCGSYRPPTISDGDCTLLLPSDTVLTETSRPHKTADLRVLSNVSADGKIENLDSYAHTVLMASVLGRVERHTLQQHNSKDPFPPWDSRSEFASIFSILLNFEGISGITTVSFSETLRGCVTADGRCDNAAAGHFIYSVILYHFNQCLLHHPFLFRKRLAPYQSRIPHSFLREALRRAREHAYQITIALRIVQKQGLSLTSFYPYVTIVAGCIHKLFSYHDDEWVSSADQKLYDYSVEFLEKARGIWGHSARIEYALRNFSPSAASAKVLVNSNAAKEDLPDDSVDIMWNLVDYGWLSDPARPSVLDYTAATSSTGELDESGGELAEKGPASQPELPADLGYTDLSSFDLNIEQNLKDDVNMDFMTSAQHLEDPWTDFLTDGDTVLQRPGNWPSPWTPRLE